MDDPHLSWPFWKFGLKRDDLFTTLQDQYNTFPSSIQDPEAFHHDVFELSHAASTAAEFHRLMSERKQCRLRELNDSLQSASFEIIANPSLIGTDQWQYALQLFRTRSLDSLVRYFASYLPDDHPWHRSDEESSSSSTGDCESVDSITPSEHIDDFLYADKPASMDDEVHHHLPLSPRSMTMYSASSAASQVDELDHGDFSLTPARTMSFSESEPDHFPLQDSCPSPGHDDASSRNLSDDKTSVSIVSDVSETNQNELLAENIGRFDYENDYAATQLPLTEVDALESETPTPKPKTEAMSTRAGAGAGGASFFPEPKPSRSTLSSSCSALLHIRRSASPTRMHLSLYPAATSTTVHTECHPISAADCREIKHQQKHTLSPARPRRRDLSPVGKGRRTPGGVVVSSSSNSSSNSSRIQKPSSEPLRSRPRGRRRDGC